MREAYLRPKDRMSTGRPERQRGGVMGSDGGGDYYELEIGNESYCSPEMLALCQIHDEIIEFLTLSRSPLGKIVLSTYRERVQALQEGLDGEVRKGPGLSIYA